MTSFYGARVLIRARKEWYGWHFPEMAKILVDNVAYAKVVLAMGMCLPSFSLSSIAIHPKLPLIFFPVFTKFSN